MARYFASSTGNCDTTSEEKRIRESPIRESRAAMILCSPFFGPVTFDTAGKILAGEKVPASIQNPGYVIDKYNVVAYLPKSF